MSDRAEAGSPAAAVRCPVLEAGAAFLNSFRHAGLLLVAVSGGSDSCALLHVFDQLLQRDDFRAFRLAAATVDHGLREGSGAEARWVEALCARRGIPHSILCWRGEKPSTGLQAAARSARYRLLAEEAQRIGACAILVGHTADDQSETAAMRGARGRGPGEAGMAGAVLLEETVWACRPFLSIRRQALRDHLRDLGETWLEDPSNSNPMFERARLRSGGTVIPSATAAPPDRLAASGREARWIERSVTVHAGHVAVIPAHALDAIGDPDHARALFRLAACIGGRTHLPGRLEQDRLVAFLAEGRPDRRTLAGVVFDRRREALFLYREMRGLKPVRIDAGDVADGRFRLCGPAGGAATVCPVRDPQGASAGLLASGVPEAIARRAAPAVLEIDGGAADHELSRVLAPHLHFVPSFDLPAADALRHVFGLDPLPLPPVRQ